MMGYAREVQKGEVSVSEFLGFNGTRSRAMGEMGDEKNLSVREYPNLGVRRSRREVSVPSGISGIEEIFRCDGELCYIAGGKLYVGGAAVGELGEGKKSIAIVGKRICIMPDKVYYDTSSGIFGRMDERVSVVYMCNAELCLELGYHYMYFKGYTDNGGGGVLDVSMPCIGGLFAVGDRVLVSGVETTIKSVSEDGDIKFTDDVFGVGGISSMLVMYKIEEVGRLHTVIICARAETAEDELGAVTGIRIAASGSDVNGRFIEVFKRTLLYGEGDEVELSSVYYSSPRVAVDDRTCSIDGIEYTEEPDGSSLFSECYIKFRSSVDFEISSDSRRKGVLTFYRSVPDMDYICEFGNRLYGVCNSDNTVVVSRLGSPFCFRDFDGTALDSYSVEVGSEGEFTGIYPYGDGVVIFKERRIHMLYGSKPSLYRLSDIDCFGVSAGGSASIAGIDGALYYQSIRGIERFSGGYPVLISRVFGDVALRDGFAATDGNRYYVSLADAVGRRRIYVYDVYYGIWHIEDGEEIVSMCELSGEVMMASSDKVYGTGGIGCGGVRWSACFGPFDLYTEGKKVISAIKVRYRLSEGAKLRLEVSFDGAEYEMLRELYYNEGYVMTSEIRLRRCDEFSVRLSGEGECRVLGMVFELREGSVRE